VTLADAIVPLSLASDFRVTGGTGPPATPVKGVPSGARAAYDDVCEVVVWLCRTRGLTEPRLCRNQPPMTILSQV